MQLTQKTTIDSKQGWITEIDIEAITADTFMLEQLIRLGIMGMTYRAKDKLKASGKLTITFADLTSMYLTGAGNSIGVAFIDDAITNLRRAGAKIANRPRKVKGETGSQSPTLWAGNIDLSDEISTKLTATSEKWEYGMTIETLADYASMLEWKSNADKRANDADLLG
jgi:hypothetical protein